METRIIKRYEEPRTEILQIKTEQSIMSQQGTLDPWTEEEIN